MLMTEDISALQPFLVLVRDAIGAILVHGIAVLLSISNCWHGIQMFHL